MPRLEVVATAQDAYTTDMHGKTAVVIDVLRATSTMSVALTNGATSIVAVPTVEEALQRRIETGEKVLLGGERNAVRIDGFDLDNSPAAYSADIVAGKRIVMTTTNGTQAIAACRDAALTLVASMLNARKTAALLVKSENDIVIVCAGTNGAFSLEDGVCAGMIADMVASSCNNLTMNDMAIAMRDIYKASGGDVRSIVGKGEHYGRLMGKGFGGDIDICLDTASDNEPMVCHNGIITLASEAATE